MSERRAVEPRSLDIHVFHPISNSGLSTAWLLATLGARTACKRVVKKDILSASIPQTCKIIEKEEYGLSLRMSSNLLYGVSLLYKQKVEYFMGEVSVVKSQLQRDFIMNRFLNRAMTTESYSGSFIENEKKKFKQSFLNEDPLFDLNYDFAHSFDEEYEKNAWKNQIRLVDKGLYSGKDSLNGYNGHSFVNVDYSRAIESFLEEDIASLEHLSEADEDLDFEFDNEGRLPVSKEVGKNLDNAKIDGLELIDFGIIEKEPDKEIEDFTSTLLDRTAANDKTFQISNFNLSVSGLDGNSATDNRRLLKRVVHDENTRISSTELRNYRDNYEILMRNSHKKQKIENNDIATFAKAVTEKLPDTLKFAYSFIYGYNITNKDASKHKKITTTNHDFDALIQELEYGRNIEFSMSSQGARFSNLEGTLQYQDDEMDFFDISLPEIENSFRIRPGTVRDGHSEDIQTHANNVNLNSNYQLIRDNGGNATASASSSEEQVDPDLMLDSTLQKFLKFLRSRANIIGEHFRGQVDIESHKDNSAEEEIMNDFSKISFSSLIPGNVQGTLTDNEQPVSRKIAANSFSCILQLTTINYIQLDINNLEDPSKLLRGEDLKITVKM